MAPLSHHRLAGPLCRAGVNYFVIVKISTPPHVIANVIGASRPDGIPYGFADFFFFFFFFFLPPHFSSAAMFCAYLL